MAKAERYRLVGFCHDCTDVDPLGCFDGQEHEVGVYDTRGEAEHAGCEWARQCSPWDFRVEVLDD